MRPHTLRWSNPRTRAIVWQALVVAVVIAVGAWLVTNLLANMEARRISVGFSFLQRPTSIPIGQTLIAYSPGDTNLRAILVGLANTAMVAVVGIVLATGLGIAVGIARLSKNVLLARLAEAYVEYVRNVPLLAHLLMIYVVMQGLPIQRAAISLGDVVFLSNRGLVLPGVVTSASWLVVALAVGLAVAAVACLRSYARRRQARTGERLPIVPISIAVLIGAPILALIAQGASIGLALPRRAGPVFQGGTTLTPELVALLAGLTVYYSAFIGEIVRGGILAIPEGQWESGAALGLERSKVLRLVILPQALRVILPPATNQYLDLAKSSSLAIAIGYPDLVAVINSIITDTGQALECVALIMAAFLGLNLAISALANWFNARIAPVGRSA